MGWPTEILSDRGIQFTSDLIKEVFRLVSADHLTTPPFHAQTNGMVERFNGSSKIMLRKMASDKPKDWDRYVPALLFAYREMPNESTGFSPLELLYGRTPRGPVSILRKVWTGSKHDQEVPNTYQYVFDLKTSLAETCRLAPESACFASQRCRHYHDRYACASSRLVMRFCCCF